MSAATQFYIVSLLVFAAVDVLAAWGLNLQFGVAGLLSFAFILFQSAGAYAAAVTTLGPDTANGGFQHYILGSTFPFPLPLVFAALAGAALALPIGLVTLRRLRSDYQAIALLVMSIIATDIATNDQHLLNGAAGLSLIPAPLQNRLAVTQLGYQWLFVLFCIVVTAGSYLVMRRLTRAPLGRAMRAMRDNEQAALSLGKNVVWLRIVTFAVGGAMAGLSGGLLVEFVGAWAPSGWLYPETFVLFTAIIIGGTGNDVGVLVGVLLVPVVIAEATQFLPNIGRPGLIDALQWVLIGVLLIVFLWLRPQGIFPERKRRFPSADELSRAVPRRRLIGGVRAGAALNGRRGAPRG
jgi:branched-chain amino acid transport system permease protein